MKIKTSELTGAALDWAVGQTEDFEVSVAKLNRSVWVRITDPKRFGERYKPSTNWAQGGPLIERFNIWLDGPICGVSIWSASVMDTQLNEFSASHDCETPLIAICRAVVACKLGDEVEVPDQLVKETV